MTGHNDDTGLLCVAGKSIIKAVIDDLVANTWLDVAEEVSSLLLLLLLSPCPLCR